MIERVMPLQTSCAQSATAFGNATFRVFGMQVMECLIRPELIVNALKEKEQEKRKE